MWDPCRQLSGEAAWGHTCCVKFDWKSHAQDSPGACRKAEVSRGDGNWPVHLNCARVTSSRKGGPKSKPCNPPALGTSLCNSIAQPEAEHPRIFQVTTINGEQEDMGLVASGRMGGGHKIETRWEDWERLIYACSKVIVT